MDLIWRVLNQLVVLDKGSMSPYLFVLCMKKLAPYVQEKVVARVWKLIHVARGGPGISQLLFADDILLFCHASSSQVKEVMDSLDDFCAVSGLRINVPKSGAMCASNVSRRRWDNLTSISSIHFMTNLGKYLG